MNWQVAISIRSLRILLVIDFKDTKNHKMRLLNSKGEV